MNELNQTKETNAITNTLSQSLKTLLQKYEKMIENNDSGGALNMLKNIEMLIATINKIYENKDFSIFLDDLTKCWNDLDNSDDIAKTLGGKIKKEIVEDVKIAFNKANKIVSEKELLNYIELSCFENDLYYNEILAKTCLKNNGCIESYNQYKKQINLAQFRGKRYKNTILERIKGE